MHASRILKRRRRVQPIEGPGSPCHPLTPTNAAADAQVKIKILKKWQQAKVFDATLLLNLHQRLSITRTPPGEPIIP